MLYVAFYTRGTIYEQEASRLRRSLDRLNLPYEIVGVPDRGSWKANTRHTATFLCEMLSIHDGPLVYLDADAVVWSSPVLFDQLDPAEHDIAVHHRQGFELLNGTLWLANNAACNAVIESYRQRVEANPEDRNEQQHLDRAIKEAAGLRLKPLPASYCWIHDIMKDDLGGDDPVIEHLQASRVCTNSSLLPNRMKRLSEIESGHHVR